MLEEYVNGAYWFNFESLNNHFLFKYISSLNKYGGF